MNDRDCSDIELTPDEMQLLQAVTEVVVAYECLGRLKDMGFLSASAGAGVCLLTSCGAVAEIYKNDLGEEGQAVFNTTVSGFMQKLIDWTGSAEDMPYVPGPNSLQ